MCTPLMVTNVLDFIVEFGEKLRSIKKKDIRKSHIDHYLINYSKVSLITYALSTLYKNYFNCRLCKKNTDSLL